MSGKTPLVETRGVNDTGAVLVSLEMRCVISPAGGVTPAYLTRSNYLDGWTICATCGVRGESWICPQSWPAIDKTPSFTDGGVRFRRAGGTQ